MSIEIIPGDCFEVVAGMADDSVECCVTSPPYLRKRVYGDSSSEFGLEATVDEYVTRLADLFDEVKRVVKGVTWLNLGDSANFSGGAGGDWKGKIGGPLPLRDKQFEPQTFLDVPGRVLHELLRRGWRLRAEVVWVKPVPRPESMGHVKRLLLQHEKIFMLSRDAGYKWFPDRLAQEGNVWEFAPGGDGDPHLAPFPDELASRCILPSTEMGDTVLDPFSGAGTTARVAHQLGRHGVGVELYA